METFDTPASANASNVKVSFTIYSWIVVSCGMLFYCFNYFLRVSPGVMQNELTQGLHITATQFGTLAGFYYWAYTPMQIPAGLLYDKFGVRFVIGFACLFATAGLGVFINAENYTMASCGRFMIGLGGAFTYIGTLKLAALWLPTNRFATVACLTTAVGMTSGAMAQHYLTKIIDIIGYREALHSALISGLGLSLLLFIVIRNNSERDAQHPSYNMRTAINLPQLLGALRLIFTNSQMWLIGIIGCLSYLPSSVFLDLWGIPYLKSVYHLSPKEAVQISSYTFYGWIISGPLIGIFSDKIKRRKEPLIVTGFFAVILLCTVFYLPMLSLQTLYIAFFMIGFCCGAHPLCFALGKENNPLQISGTAVAITNMMIMSGGAIFQPLVGRLLDWHTNSPIGSNGLPTYTSADYTFALSVIPLGIIISLFLSLFLKETYCETKSTPLAQNTLATYPET